MEYPSDNAGHFVRSDPQPPAVRFKRLSLPFFHLALRLPVLVNQFSAKPKTNWTSYAEAEASHFALPGVNLHRELSAEFCRHNALDIFDDTRDEAAVVIELFGAVSDPDAI